MQYSHRSSTSKSYCLSRNKSGSEYVFKLKVDDDILKFKLIDKNDIYRGTYLASDFLKLNSEYKALINEKEIMNGKIFEDIEEGLKQNNFYFFEPKHGKVCIMFYPVISEVKKSFNVNLFLENYNYVRDYSRDNIMLTREQAEAFNKRE